ncbi:MAG: MotA/TolQ/ExbB proton channel family protein [Bdellovibrionales bacterium]
MNIANIFQQDNPVLIAVFMLLIAMSVASWYIIFWKALSLRRERNILAAFRRRYAKMPDWPRHEMIGKPPEGTTGLLVRETERLSLVLANADTSERREILSLHLVQALDIAKVRLDKGLTVLASVGSSSPFIGLFGTVWGIYGALIKISAEGNAGLNVVAGPMGEALVATAIGLFAAIPAVLAYNGFVRQNRLLVQDLRHIAEQLSFYLPLAPASRNQSEPVRLVKDVR